MAKKKPWYDQDNFWETFERVMFTPERLENTSAEVDNIIKLLDIQADAHILDLCCGIGRHTLELARRGFTVTGVDRTRPYLEKAKKHAGKENLAIEFIQSDMRQFQRPGAFDTALNLFTSFGYFDDPEDDRKVINNIYDSLKPGGKLLMEMMGKEVLARIFRERDWHEQDDFLILQERKLSRNWSWIDSHWIMIRDTQRFETTISHRLYSAIELSALLSDGGFTNIRVFGNLEGNEYDHQAKRLVVAAQKT